MEKFTVNHEGADYHIQPQQTDNKTSYVTTVNGHNVTFHPDEKGTLNASHDHIPNEFLSKLARKIESYFF